MTFSLVSLPLSAFVFRFLVVSCEFALSLLTIDVDTERRSLSLSARLLQRKGTYGLYHDDGVANVGGAGRAGRGGGEEDGARNQRRQQEQVEKEEEEDAEEDRRLRGRQETIPLLTIDDLIVLCHEWMNEQATRNGRTGTGAEEETGEEGNVRAQVQAAVGRLEAGLGDFYRLCAAINTAREGQARASAMAVQ